MLASGRGNVENKIKIYIISQISFLVIKMDTRVRRSGCTQIEKDPLHPEHKVGRFIWGKGAQSARRICKLTRVGHNRTAEKSARH